MIGDTLFGIGVVVLGWFVLGLKTGWSLSDRPDEVARQFPESVASESVRSGRDERSPAEWVAKDAVRGEI